MEARPWFKFYAKGVPQEINPEQYSSLVDMYLESFRKYSDAIAYENIGSKITFDQLNKLSLNFANYLQHKLGLEKGDRIAIQMPNLMQYPIALIGAHRAGLVVVNTNPLYTPREMEHQFKDSGAKALVILENFASNLQGILKNTEIEHVIISKIGDMLGGLKGSIVNLVIKHVKKMVPDYKIEGVIPFKETIKHNSSYKLEDPQLKSEDLAFLQYTGGTTGVSKGAMLTHRNLVSNMEQIHKVLSPVVIESEELAITALPLYHVFALVVNCLAMLKIGARNVLITNPRDFPAFIKELKKYNFTLITGVNTLFNALLNQEKFRELDFSSSKISAAGGMAVQNSVALKWKEVTGHPIVEGYGLTETSPVLTINPFDGTERIGTIGLPVPSTDIKIMDDDGNELPVGERGEICASGPQVMKGYWNREKDTREMFHGEWLKTGDIGIMDEDGFFKIVDRKKEMILVSGFNVYPNEVEDVISGHPKVLEVGVIGVPDEKSTEVVKCFIVKKDDSLSEDEIKEYCQENLTAYKRPKYVEFRTEMPKSNVGKILRRLLKEGDLQEA
jgi:long-chain acyl-CoA synthetase